MSNNEIPSGIKEDLNLKEIPKEYQPTLHPILLSLYKKHLDSERSRSQNDTIKTTRDGISYGKLVNGKYEIDENSVFWDKEIASVRETESRQLELGNKADRLGEVNKLITDILGTQYMTKYEKYIHVQALLRAYVDRYIKPGRAPAWH